MPSNNVRGLANAKGRYLIVSMLLHETSSAETNRSSLAPETPFVSHQYIWSPGDIALCIQIFSAASTAGVSLSDDCPRAVSRAENPDNKVNLAGVILGELGSESFLSDEKNRGIATLAAGFFRSSSNPAFQIAGQTLMNRVSVAERRVASPSVGAASTYPGTEGNWKMAGGPVAM